MEQKLDFRKVCEHCYDPIHVADGKGTIIFINEAYTRITGITPETYLGRNIFDVEREGVLYKGSVSEQVIRTGRQVNNIAHIHGKDIDVLVTGVPIFDEAGQIELVVANTRDISGLKAMEQELQSLTEERKKAEEELAYLRRRQMGDRRATHESQAMRMVAELMQRTGGQPMETPRDVKALLPSVMPRYEEPVEVGYAETEEVEEEPRERTKADVQREQILRALRRNNGRRKEAAAELFMSERTLYRKIKELGIEE